jgi:hypothetical protein
LARRLCKTILFRTSGSDRLPDPLSLTGEVHSCYTGNRMNLLQLHVT